MPAFFFFTQNREKKARKMDSSRVNYLEKTGRWGKCGKNNKNANDLRPARDDKGIKALKQKGGVFMR